MDKKTAKETDVPVPEHWHPAAVPVDLGTAAGPPAEEPPTEPPAKKAPHK